MKKLGVICLVLIVAVGCIGVAYGSWSQTLTVNGRVDTASFDVNFTNATSPTAPTGGVATNVISNPGPSIGKTATINVTKAYPGWTGNFVLTVTNSSTIPVTLALTENTDTGNLFSKSVNPSSSVSASGTFNYTITVTIPADWSISNAGGTFTATYSLVAAQGT